MASPGPSRRNRVRAALAAAVVQCGLAVAVIWGLAARGTFSPEREAAIVAVPLAPSPTPTPSRQPESEGGSAPRGPPVDRTPRAQPSPAVVLADPTPSMGDSGGGGESGVGSGSGSGGGSGSGSGTGEAAVRVAGALSDRDYPRSAGGAGGTVAIRFRVRADGGVDQCRPIASSGVAVLDDLTCELVERRFRYRSARDAYGQPIDSEQRTSFTWGARGR